MLHVKIIEMSIVISLAACVDRQNYIFDLQGHSNYFVRFLAAMLNPRLEVLVHFSKVHSEDAGQGNSLSEPKY